MEALAELGARDEALLQFRALQDTYRRELGVEVSADTRALVRGIEAAQVRMATSLPHSEATLPASPALAVHPLVCLSDHREKRLFASSLSGSLVTTLSKLPYLRVVAMGTAGKSSKHPEDLVALDRASAADYILEGQMTASDDRVAVSIAAVLLPGSVSQVIAECRAACVVGAWWLGLANGNRNSMSGIS